VIGRATYHAWRLRKFFGKARRKDRPRRTCEDNIKLDLRNIGCDNRDLIHQAWDKGHRWALVNTVTNLRVQ
jgi:hypothetical protein